MDPTLVGLLIGVILVIVTLLLIFMGRGRLPAAVEEKSQMVETPVSQAPTPAPVKPDDLTLIEGIGPKIADILKQTGITTFAQLAATDASTLETLLKQNGLPFAKPQSWAEQARLAAEGKLDDLKALQEKLIAGR